MIYLIIITGIFLWFLFRKKRSFKCPNCGQEQKNYYILKKDDQTVMTHGRTTISGRSDKRYNTRYETNTIITYGVECVSCGICYSNRNGHVNEIKPKEFYENIADKKWLYILYEESDMLGDYFKNLQKDKSELLKGKNFELNKKYGFRNNLEIKKVFELIDSINQNTKKNYSASWKKLNQTDANLGKIWSDYDRAVIKSMQTQKAAMDKLGLDSSHIKEFTDKYGIEIDQNNFENNAESTELLTLLNSLMNQ